MLELVCGIAALVLALYCVIGLLQRRKFAQGLQSVSEEDYPLKKLMPIGLFTQQLFLSGNPGTLANTDVRRKLGRLYGERRLQFSAIVYTADALTYLLVILAITLFLGAITGEPRVLVLGVMLDAFVVLFMLPKRLDDNIVQRQRSITLEFPDFLSKFILLLGAGLTVQESWTASIKGWDMNTPLYRELAETNREMTELGMSVSEALMNLSIRSHDAEINRFVSTVVQYVEYRGEDLSIALTRQSSEAWRNRKQEALRLGQVAETKLTGTMILMFLAIVLIVLAPAIMNMDAVF